VDKEKCVLFCLYKYVFGAFKAKRKLKITLKVWFSGKKTGIALEYFGFEFP
jgi:hypothetical protein